MHPTAHRCKHHTDRPITVVDGTGSHTVCSCCTVTLIAEGGKRADVTVFVAPRAKADA